MWEFVRYIFIIFLACLLFFSCRKDQLVEDSNALLNFSTDTIMFDTVFTDIGSVTLQLKVYNPYKQAVNISSISLGKSTSSNFRLNINGFASDEARNIVLQANDSLYIFVEVTVNPNLLNNPFVIHDSIIFNINGNRQDVDLVAWGQNANYINGQMISSETWTSERPYLIYNSIGVDSNSVLTIEAGSKIYFHKNSGLLVWGTLIVNGSFEEPVIIQGDRLESDYEDIPGQWGGIRLYSGSGNNSINWTEIKNAIVGIQIGTLDNQPTQNLQLNNCKIMNMNYAGIYALGSVIEVNNCVISDCGFYAVALLVGGSYTFNHCTVANYWKYSNRTTSSVIISNNAQFGEALYVGDLDKSEWNNSIIYGTYENEIGIGVDAGAALNYRFHHCMIKLKSDYDISNVSNYYNIYREDSPDFINHNESDFQLDTLSPAMNKGDINIVNQNLLKLEY
ncbi:MAG: hypothetical protein ABIJ97_10160, partial [Bacteroidota bacterium]